jgi:hypothetical protein
MTSRRCHRLASVAVLVALAGGLALTVSPGLLLALPLARPAPQSNQSACQVTADKVAAPPARMAAGQRACFQAGGRRDEARVSAHDRPSHRAIAARASVVNANCVAGVYLTRWPLVQCALSSNRAPACSNGRDAVRAPCCRGKARPCATCGLAAVCVRPGPGRLAYARQGGAGAALACRPSACAWQSEDREEVCATVGGGRSGPGSSPCSRPPQNRGRTSLRSPRTRGLPQRRGALSSSRR